jgi:hypothetical protein
MSAKTPMNIQINMNQKKKTIIAHSTLPNVHSYASIEAPLCSPLFGRGGSLPQHGRGCILGERAVGSG